MSMQPLPLAFDRAGDPITVEPGAAWFRVVHVRPGAQAAVQDLDGGGPLFVPITCTPAELRQRSGPGAFTLIQVDENRATIEKADRAHIEIPQEKSKPKAEENAILTAFNQTLAAVLKGQEEQRVITRELLGGVTALAKINTEALDTMAKLATGQPIREFETAQPGAPPPPPPQSDAVQKALEVFGPLVMQLGPLLVQWMRSRLGDGQPPTQAQLAAAGVQS